MTLRRRPRAATRPSPGVDGAKNATARRLDDVRQQLIVDAMRRDGLRSLAQPIVDPVAGTIVGAETLVSVPDVGFDADLRGLRNLLDWTDDSALATLNGLLVERVGGALGQIETGSDVGSVSADPFVSVSVAERFVASDTFLATVKEAVRRSGLEPSQLLLSIDGGPGFDQLWTNMQRLKSHGVRVAVHRFSLGSGAADLVRRYPIDMLRLESELLREDDGAIVAQIVKLAGNFDCSVVVEGVADDECAMRLQELGCHYAMGPFYGPPRRLT